MTRMCLQGVADEAATLGLGDQLPHGVTFGRGVELDLESRLDVHERVQPIPLALRDGAVGPSPAGNIEAGSSSGVVHARQGAADESCEYEVLGPPLVLTLEGAASELAQRCSLAVDADFELENSRFDHHGSSLPGAIRALA